MFAILNNRCHNDDLVKDGSNSTANALQLLQFRTRPSVCRMHLYSSKLAIPHIHVLVAIYVLECDWFNLECISMFSGATN